MRSTYKQFYYINRGRVKADGTTSIFCRITTKDSIKFLIVEERGVVKPKL